MPQLKAAAQAALDGNASGAERALNRAGTLAANGVRRYMTITGFTPLADSTVEARARRGRKGAKAELARRAAGESPGTDLVKPLIDTGQYRRAITHVVRDTAGTTITNGSARDKNGIIWNFPASVAIGVDGTVLVTATCANSGSVAAMAGTITTINTPTRGWVSVTNPAAATVGSPAETDAELRIRQGQSVALPSITPFEGVDGAIANVNGVTRHKLYENDTGSTDSNGLPPHSISAIVDGGDVTEIAQTIRGNKGQGTATYGTTSVTVPDKYGNPHVIKFSRSSDVPVYARIKLKVFTGYNSQIGQQIQQAISDYINSLMIGDSVLLSRIYSPANLGVVSGGNARYYDIQELTIGKSPGALSSSNIDIRYNESASCTPENIVITVE